MSSHVSHAVYFGCILAGSHNELSGTTTDAQLESDSLYLSLLMTMPVPRLTNKFKALFSRHPTSEHKTPRTPGS